MNSLSMSPKKSQEDPAEIFSNYMNAVWMDFDNIRETNLLRRIVRKLKVKARGKRAK